VARDKKLSVRQKSLSLMVACLFIAIIFRLVYIQVVHHDYYSRRAEHQQIEKVSLDCDRGTIFDKNGITLAVSRDIFSLCAEPGRIEDPVRTSREISRVLGTSASWLEKKFRSKRDFEWIARRVPIEKKRKIDGMNLNGLYFRLEKGRHYPGGSLLAQVLGFCGLDNIGRWGLEESLQDYLQGTSGWVYMERDACGKKFVDLSLPKKSPVPGCNVTLTIDSRLQEIVEMALAHTVEDVGAKSGSIVAIDPANGDVLAMASYPTVDLYDVWPPIDTRVYNPLRNRVTMDTYEPGSTFKLISMAALLEKHTVRPEELVFCENGTYRVGRRTIEDSHPEKWLTVKEVFSRSSNIGMCKLIDRLKDMDLLKTIKDFGIGSPTGIEFISEEKGLLNQPGDAAWSDYSMQSLSYGQEVSATALQMVMAFSAVANGGELLVPHIVKEIKRPDGKVVWSSEKQVLWNCLSAESNLVLKDFLAEVVRTGTGTRAGVGSVPIGGKTGTAQKAVINQGYVHGKYVSSFGGFFPVDSPEIVIYVAIDEPQEKHYGGEVAAPAFREIIELMLLSCPDVVGIETLTRVEGLNRVYSAAVERSLEPARVPVVGRGTTLFIFPAGASDRRTALRTEEAVVMPELVGLSARDALRVAEGCGLDPGISGSGFVVRQNPSAGTILSKNDGCFVKCSFVKEI